MPTKTLSKKSPHVSQKKQSLEELFKLEKVARQYAEEIIETLWEPLLVLDTNLKVILANKAFYQTFKVNPEETIGQFIFDLGNGQWNIPALKKLLQDILPKNTVFENYEVKHNFETIGLKTMLLNARRIPRPSEKPEIILLAIEDITAHTLLETKLLRANEENYKNIFDHTAEGVLLAELGSKKFHMGNSAICQMLGYSSNEIKSLGVNDIHPKKDLPYVSKQFERQAKGEITLARDLPLKRKDGSVLYADVNATTVKFAGKTYLMGFFHDNTERKKKEEAQQASEEKLRDLFENSNDIITYTDNQSKILDVNRRIKDVLGYLPEEIKGKKFADLGILSLKDVPRILKLFAETIITGKPQKITELELNRKDGSKVFMEVATRFIKTDHKIKGVVNSYRDITERKRTEQKMIENNKAKDDFLNIAAHDLRTPISGIKANTEMILGGDYGEIPSKLKIPLEDINKANINLAKMVDNFLTISRIEKGRISINPQLMDISEIIDSIVKQMKPSIEKKGLKFSYEIPTKLPLVMADSDNIPEVFVNLFDNAIKYTDKGSISLKVLVKKDWVVVAIADTGKGIAISQQEDLFEKYTQVGDDKRVVHGKGTGLGLGLYISKQIIEGCKGKIWVKSELGKGSTFYFSLSLANTPIATNTNTNNH